MLSEVLLVDNFDSFTFNLADALFRLGATVTTYRNTASAARLIERASERRAAIVLSPGPGAPGDAGCCLDVVERARGRVPVLGICLGHQCLLAAGGVEIERAPHPVHGEAASLEHDGAGPFAGLPSPLKVARYHSLGGRSVPEGFEAHGTCAGLVFAASARRQRAVGLQFHPESILTPLGDAILSSSLAFLAHSGADR